jgi:glycine/D-amino acid oxidase-like deaminating enzyme
MRYSFLSLVANAVGGHKAWPAAWRKAVPKPAYEVIVIGGGGHGLATAYYLARNHGIANVAVLEKGWIGGGNVGRNTTIVRSNYLLPGNIPLLRTLHEALGGLEQDINYNAMVSQRGVLNLYHSDGQRDAYARRGNAMRLHGIDAELLDREGVRGLYPFLNFDQARFPIQGGLLQRRGGTARHDAVAWGYARAASAAASTSSRTAPSPASCARAAASTASRPPAARSAREGRPWRWRAAPRRSRHGGAAPADREPRAAGLRLGGAEADHPRRHHLRRRPFLHQPVRQGRPRLRRRHRRLQFLRPARQPAGRRGRLRGRHGADAAPSAGCGCCASWGGIMDMSMDGSPIIDRTPLDGLYLNAGWCYGGFKATPGSGRGLRPPHRPRRAAPRRRRPHGSTASPRAM